VIQPNGSTLHCFVSGDEYFNWIHDNEGFTIIQGTDGFYYYGVETDGLVVPSAYRVNAADSVALGLKKWAKISDERYYEIRKNYHLGDNLQHKAPYSGELNYCCLYQIP
jgi:hypothetical protein